MMTPGKGVTMKRDRKRCARCGCDKQTLMRQVGGSFCKPKCYNQSCPLGRWTADQAERRARWIREAALALQVRDEPCRSSDWDVMRIG